MYNLFNVIGLAGVAKDENPHAFKYEKIFQYGISLVAIWLPIQWYCQQRAIFTPLDITISNWFIWGILFLEIVTLTCLVENKKKFLANNWLGLVIVLVCFPPLWWYPSLITAARFARLLIFLRILVPSSKTLIEILSTNKLGTTLLVAIVVTIFCGLSITFFDPAIRTPWDGVWWAWETVTTVGYGDEAPSTVAGRLIAIALMIFGAGLFSLFTANLSAYFVSKGNLNKSMIGIKKEEDELMQRLRSIEKQLEDVQKHLKKLDTKK